MRKIDIPGIGKLRAVTFEVATRKDIFLYNDWNEVKDEFWKRLRRGQEAHFAQGVAVWIDYLPLWDSERHDYIWHEDSNHIRVRQLLKTRNRLAKIKGRVLKTFWMSYDSYERLG